MPRLADLLPRFSLRAIVVAIAVIAAGFGAALHPSPFVLHLVGNVFFIAILIAGCLAIGFPQPRRSFWLAFLLASLGFMVIDKFSHSHYVSNDVFTRQLTNVIHDALPEVGVTGEPNSTEYFRYDSSRLPVIYHRYGDTGKRTATGFLTEDDAIDKGVIGNGTTLADLPHSDHLPAASSRLGLLPFCLAMVFGLLGGVIASTARVRSP